jgi:hypothetical protein
VLCTAQQHTACKDQNTFRWQRQGLQGTPPHTHKVRLKKGGSVGKQDACVNVKTWVTKAQPPQPEQQDRPDARSNTNCRLEPDTWATSDGAFTCQAIIQQSDPFDSCKPALVPHPGFFCQHVAPADCSALCCLMPDCTQPCRHTPSDFCSHPADMLHLCAKPTCAVWTPNPTGGSIRPSCVSMQGRSPVTGLLPPDWGLGPPQSFLWWWWSPMIATGGSSSDVLACAWAFWASCSIRERKKKGRQAGGGRDIVQLCSRVPCQQMSFILQAPATPAAARNNFLHV